MLQFETIMEIFGKTYFIRKASGDSLIEMIRTVLENLLSKEKE